MIGAPPLSGATLPALVEAQAARNPGAPAVVFGDESVAYGELNARANRLAHELIARGIGPEDLVGIALERSIDTIVTLLAVLKAGAAYLPLDPAYPAARLAHMVRDARPTLQELLPALRDRPVHDPSDSERRTLLEAQHPAYVIYTSGSTGTPKGVVVSHSGIPSMVRAHAIRLRLTPAARVLQFGSLSFDASVWEIAGALVAGATLVLIRDDARTGDALAATLRTQRVTHATLPPVVLTTLEPGDDLPLAVLAVAGEACPGSIVERWSGGRTMINGYGLTETTVCATLSEPLSGADAPSIGRAIDGTRVYVLNEHLEPAPAGVTGELYVGGAGLARGYLRRPGLTAERFVADPFAPEPGARMYRTGDLARRRTDGSLDIIGRRDHQVKIRGHRVELGEIEAVLNEQPGIGQAVVVAFPDAHGTNRIVAYLAGTGDRRPDAAAVREQVREQLPDAMIPARFVVVDSFACTPNGKIDRSALPLPELDTTAYRAARTPPERALCALAGDVLGLERVGIDDDFFALGADSISVARFVARARTAGIQLTQRAVFEHPTVAGLATVAQSISPAGDPLQRRDLPLAPLQRDLLETRANESIGTLAQICLELEGPLDALRMGEAVAAVIAHHAALRAGFVRDAGGRIVQTIAPRAAAPWRVVDIGPGAECSTAVRTDRDVPFVRAHAPLIRFSLLRSTPERHALVVTYDQLVLDAWSLPLVVRDLFALYRNGGGAAALRPAPSIAGYAEWLLATDRAAARDTWAAHLRGAAPPVRLAGPIVEAGRPAVRRHRAELTAEVTACVQRFAQATGVTPSTVVRGLWTLLLAQLGEREDILFGVVVSGRPAEVTGVEEMVGAFTNVLPLRVCVRAGIGLAEVVAAIAHEQLALLDAQHLTLTDIAGASGADLDFDSVLAFQNYPQGGDELLTPAPGVRVVAIGAYEDPVPYPLCLTIVPGPQMRLRFDYHAERFPPDRIVEIAERFSALAGASC
jgi:amino acid adenylation domain-containing protein